MSTGSQPKEQNGLPTLRSPTTPQRPDDANLDAPPDESAAAVFSSRYVKQDSQIAASGLSREERGFWRGPLLVLVL